MKTELPGLIKAIEITNEQIDLADCSRKKTAGRLIRQALIERVRQCDTDKQFEFLYLLPS